LGRVIDSLTALSIRYLVGIGGDDTTYGAAQIAERAKGKIGIVTVPKTIDNDLPLPENAPTFGFETARAVGAEIVESLMEDARSTGRWYLAISMGRKSGSLALSMCKAVRRYVGSDSGRIPGQ
jgi:ATP-dependent phosphofructokinase / diphosphate-dependent phosphofructokinase